MKKRKIIVLFILLILLVGCEKRKDIKEKEEKEENSSWIINKEESTYPFQEEEKKRFKKTINDKNLEPIAILGEQVVAGKNTMLLCLDEKKGIYKIVTIYEDLKGKRKVTNSSPFNPIQYSNQNTAMDKEIRTGGWNVSMPGKPIMLEEELQYNFEKAVENQEEISYYPIRVLATNQEEGKNIILSYGRLNSGNEKTGIFILTIEQDKLRSTYYLDLKEWN